MEILEGNAKYFGAWSLVQGYAHLLFHLGVFMMGLDKLKLYAKFEVASFSHCVNIKKEAT